MQTITITEPAYFNSFCCTGPACSDNCCHTWDILIDKPHYHQYIKESMPEFKTLCIQTVEKLKDEATPEHYARLKLQGNGRCGFQAQDGGCLIYRLLGPNALSNTCTIYPRRKAEFISGCWEFSLSMSCEEAAKLILFSPESKKLKTYSRSICDDNPFDRQAAFGIGTNGLYEKAPFFGSALRQVCLELICIPELTIQERILSIGLLLKKIDDLKSSHKEDQIIPMSLSYLTTIQLGNFKGFFEKLEYQREAHLAAFKLPMAHLLAAAQKPVLNHLLDILQPWCDINSAGEYLAGERAASFLINEAAKTADPFILKHEKEVENYFFSYIFSGLFPFLYYKRGVSFEEHGILLAEQFALLRILLTLSSDTIPEETRLIQAVVSLSRICQHADLAYDMETLSNTVALDGLAHAAYLLR